jgi:hypothetical protein
VRAAPVPVKAVAWAGSPPRRGEGGKYNRGKTWGKAAEKLWKSWGKLWKSWGKLGKPMEFSKKMGTYRKKTREIGKHVGKTRGYVEQELIHIMEEIIMTTLLHWGNMNIA